VGGRRGGLGDLREGLTDGIDEEGGRNRGGQRGVGVRQRSSWRWRHYNDLEAQVSHGIERGGREEHVYELTGVGDMRDDRNPAGGAALGSAPRAAAQTVNGGPS
jgi:hypothetical protein